MPPPPACKLFQMKTAKQWLEELPDKYRKKALSQVMTPNDKAVDMPDALGNLLNYDYTKEGRAFWGAVKNHYKIGSPLPPIPTQDDGKTSPRPLTKSSPPEQKVLAHMMGEGMKLSRENWIKVGPWTKYGIVKKLLIRFGHPHDGKLITETVNLLNSHLSPSVPGECAVSAASSGTLKQKTINKMNKYYTTPVATPTFVYGQDVSEMDARTIISQIKGLQAQKKANSEIGLESQFIEQENLKIQTAINTLVEALDKFAETTAE